jgi:outer membrane biosynthesis protein TonB
MNRKISDEQLEKIAQKLLRDFAPDDEMVNEIADSPKLWWQVRSRIETQKSQQSKPRLFAFRWQIWAFGALAVMFSLGLAGLFWDAKKDENSVVQITETPINQPKTETAKTVEKPEQTLSEPERKTENTKIVPTKKLLSKSAPQKAAEKNPRPQPEKTIKPGTVNLIARQTPKRQKKNGLPDLTKEETKTDFIALAYAPTSDSGQIVRMKVPSSMMVSLGVANNVKKNTELVDAEVVIGDDGLARAIRFIR